MTKLKTRKRYKIIPLEERIVLDVSAPTNELFQLDGTEGTKYANNKILATFTTHWGTVGVPPAYTPTTSTWFMQMAWGDGTATDLPYTLVNNTSQRTSAITIRASATANHAYAEQGSYAGDPDVGPYLFVQNNIDFSDYMIVPGSFTIANAPLTAGSGVSLSGFQNSSFPSGTIIAKFTDPGNQDGADTYNEIISGSNINSGYSLSTIDDPGFAAHTGHMAVVATNLSFNAIGTSYSYSVSATDSDPGAVALVQNESVTIDAPADIVTVTRTLSTLGFTKGASSTHQLGTFTDSQGDTDPAHFSFVVNWGDGSTDTSVTTSYINTDGSGYSHFTVSDSHIYNVDSTSLSPPNVMSFSVAHSFVSGAPVSSGNVAITISDSPITITSYTASKDWATFEPLTDVYQLATFYDPDSSDSPSNFTASVQSTDGRLSVSLTNVFIFHASIPDGSGYIDDPNNYLVYGALNVSGSSPGINETFTLTISETSGVSATANMEVNLAGPLSLSIGGGSATLSQGSHTIVGRLTDGTGTTFFADRYTITDMSITRTNPDVSSSATSFSIVTTNGFMDVTGNVNFTSDGLWTEHVTVSSDLPYANFSSVTATKDVSVLSPITDLTAGPAVDWSTVGDTTTDYRLLATFYDPDANDVNASFTASVASTDGRLHLFLPSYDFIKNPDQHNWEIWGTLNFTAGGILSSPGINETFNLTVTETNGGYAPVTVGLVANLAGPLSLTFSDSTTFADGSHTISANLTDGTNSPYFTNRYSVTDMHILDSSNASISTSGTVSANFIGMNVTGNVNYTHEGTWREFITVHSSVGAGSDVSATPNPRIVTVTDSTPIVLSPGAAVDWSTIATAAIDYSLLGTFINPDGNSDSISDFTASVESEVGGLNVTMLNYYVSPHVNPDLSYDYSQPWEVWGRIDFSGSTPGLHKLFELLVTESDGGYATRTAELEANLAGPLSLSFNDSTLPQGNHTILAYLSDGTGSSHFFDSYSVTDMHITNLYNSSFSATSISLNKLGDSYMSVTGDVNFLLDGPWTEYIEGHSSLGGSSSFGGNHDVNIVTPIRDLTAVTTTVDGTTYGNTDLKLLATFYDPDASDNPANFNFIPSVQSTDSLGRLHVDLASYFVNKAPFSQNYWEVWGTLDFSGSSPGLGETYSLTVTENGGGYAPLTIDMGVANVAGPLTITFVDSTLISQGSTHQIVAFLTDGTGTTYFGDKYSLTDIHVSNITNLFVSSFPATSTSLVVDGVNMTLRGDIDYPFDGLWTESITVHSTVGSSNSFTTSQDVNVITPITNLTAGAPVDWTIVGNATTGPKLLATFYDADANDYPGNFIAEANTFMDSSSVGRVNLVSYDIHKAAGSQHNWEVWGTLNFGSTQDFDGSTPGLNQAFGLTISEYGGGYDPLTILIGANLAGPLVVTFSDSTAGLFDGPSQPHVISATLSDGTGTDYFKDKYITGLYVTDIYGNSTYTSNTTVTSTTVNTGGVESTILSLSGTLTFPHEGTWLESVSISSNTALPGPVIFSQPIFTVGDTNPMSNLQAGPAVDWSATDNKYSPPILLGTFTDPDGSSDSVNDFTATVGSFGSGVTVSLVSATFSHSTSDPTLWEVYGRLNFYGSDPGLGKTFDLTITENDGGYPSQTTTLTANLLGIVSLQFIDATPFSEGSHEIKAVLSDGTDQTNGAHFLSLYSVDSVFIYDYAIYAANPTGQIYWDPSLHQIVVTSTVDFPHEGIWQEFLSVHVNIGTPGPIIGGGSGVNLHPYNVDLARNVTVTDATPIVLSPAADIDWSLDGGTLSTSKLIATFMNTDQSDSAGDFTATVTGEGNLHVSTPSIVIQKNATIADRWDVFATLNFLDSMPGIGQKFTVSVTESYQGDYVVSPIEGTLNLAGPLSLSYTIPSSNTFVEGSYVLTATLSDGTNSTHFFDRYSVTAINYTGPLGLFQYTGTATPNGNFLDIESNSPISFPNEGGYTIDTHITNSINNPLGTTTVFQRNVNVTDTPIFVSAPVQPVDGSLDGSTTAIQRLIATFTDNDLSDTDAMFDVTVAGVSGLSVSASNKSFVRDGSDPTLWNVYADINFNGSVAGLDQHFNVTINHASVNYVVASPVTANLAGPLSLSYTIPSSNTFVEGSYVLTATLSDGTGTSHFFDRYSVTAINYTGPLGSFQYTGTLSSGIITSDSPISFPTEGGYTIYTHIHNTINSASGTTTVLQRNVNVIDAPLIDGQEVTGIAATEGLLLSQATIATFIDSNPVQQSSSTFDSNEYTTTSTSSRLSLSNVNYTLGSGGIITVKADLLFFDAGNQTFNVTINDHGATPISLMDTANVADAALTITSIALPIQISATEGTALGSNYVIASFNDAAGAYSDIFDLSATISGIGQSGAVKIYSLGDGNYNVKSDPLNPFMFTEQGNDQHFTITINDTGGSTVSASIIANVEDAALTGNAVTIAGIKGQLINQATVATFRDGNSNPDLSDYILSTTTSSSFVMLSDANFSIDVTGLITVKADVLFTLGGGNQNFNVTISDIGGAYTSLTDTVIDIVLAPNPESALEGSLTDFSGGLGNIIGQLIVSNLHDFSFTVTGDNLYSSPIITYAVVAQGEDGFAYYLRGTNFSFGKFGLQTFTIHAHEILAGNLGIDFDIINTVVVNNALVDIESFDVFDNQLTFTTINAQVGVPTGSVVIANNFFDHNPHGQASDFSIRLSGAGISTSTANPSLVFMNDAGVYSISTSGLVFNTGGDNQSLTLSLYEKDASGNDVLVKTFTDIVNVASVPLDVTPSSTLIVTEGVPLEAGTTIASYIDSNPNSGSASYTATIDWDGAEPVFSPESLDTSGGYLSLLSAHTFDFAGIDSQAILSISRNGAPAQTQNLSFDVAEGVFSLIAGGNVSHVEGISSIDLATFTFTGLDSVATNYIATVDLDGAGHAYGPVFGTVSTSDGIHFTVSTSIGSSSIVNFDVGTLSPIVSVSHGTRTAITNAGDINLTITDALLNGSAASGLAGTEGESLAVNTQIATFINSNANDEVSYTILNASGIGDGDLQVNSLGGGHYEVVLINALVLGKAGDHSFSFDVGQNDPTETEIASISGSIHSNEAALSGTDGFASGREGSVHYDVVLGSFNSNYSGDAKEEFSISASSGLGGASNVHIIGGAGSFQIVADSLTFGKNAPSDLIYSLDISGGLAGAHLAGSIYSDDAPLSAGANGFVSGTEGGVLTNVVLGSFNSNYSGDAKEEFSISASSGLSGAINMHITGSAGNFQIVAESLTLGKHALSDLSYTIDVGDGIVEAHLFGSIHSNEAALSAGANGLVSGTEGDVQYDVVLGSFNSNYSGDAKEEFSISASSGLSGASNVRIIGSAGNFQVVADSVVLASTGLYGYTIDISGGLAGAQLAGSLDIANAALDSSGITQPSLPSLNVNQAFSGAVAIFHDQNLGDLLSDFSASIDWGDGSSSAGVISALANGQYSISGSHSFSTAGSKAIVVHINDVEGSAFADELVINRSLTVVNNSVILATAAPLGTTIEGLYYNNIKIANIDLAHLGHGLTVTLGAATNVAVTDLRLSDNGSYIQADLVVADDGNFSFTLNISDSTDSVLGSTLVSGSALDANLSAGTVLNVKATEGVALSGVLLGTFRNIFGDEGGSAPGQLVTNMNVSATGLDGFASGLYIVKGTTTLYEVRATSLLFDQVGVNPHAYSLNITQDGDLGNISLSGNVTVADAVISSAKLSKPISAILGVENDGVLLGSFTNRNASESDPNLISGDYRINASGLDGASLYLIDQGVTASGRTFKVYADNLEFSSVSPAPFSVTITQASGEVNQALLTGSFTVLDRGIAINDVMADGLLKEQQAALVGVKLATLSANFTLSTSLVLEALNQSNVEVTNLRLNATKDAILGDIRALDNGALSFNLKVTDPVSLASATVSISDVALDAPLASGAQVNFVGNPVAGALVGTFTDANATEGASIFTVNSNNLGLNPGDFSITKNGSVFEVRATGINQTQTGVTPYALTVGQNNGDSNIIGLRGSISIQDTNGIKVTMPAADIIRSESPTAAAITLFTFIDAVSPLTTSLATNYAASIDWGDGLTSVGTVTVSGGVYTVKGTRAFDVPGLLTPQISIINAGVTTLVRAGSLNIKVNDVALSLVTTPAVSGFMEDTPLGNALLAQFKDNGGLNNGSIYRATVDWKDGSSSVEEIQWNGSSFSTTQNASDLSISYDSGSGTFSVLGNHQYFEGGTYSAAIVLSHDQAANTSTSKSLVIGESPVVEGADVEITVTEANKFSGIVAYFRDSDLAYSRDGNIAGIDSLSHFKATIDWDGAGAMVPVNGTIAYLGGDLFSVSGTVTLPNTIELIAKVVVTHDTSAPLTIDTPIHVQDAAITYNQLGYYVYANSQVNGEHTFSGTVSSFKDAKVGATVGQYSQALITWGDGYSDLGRIEAKGGGIFNVVFDGTHTFANTVDVGLLTGNVTITQANGGPAIVTSLYAQSGQLLFAVDQSDGSLISIEHYDNLQPDSIVHYGQLVTSKGNIIGSGGIMAFALDAMDSGGKVRGFVAISELVDGNTVYSIGVIDNILDAAGRTVVTTFKLSGVTINKVGTDFVDTITGLAIDPMSGNLFGVVSHLNGTASTLFVVDKTRLDLSQTARTAYANTLGNLVGQDEQSALIVNNARDMLFNPTDGKLYVVDGTTDKLYEINKNTGHVLGVANSSLLDSSNGNSPLADVQALAWDGTAGKAIGMNSVMNGAEQANDLIGLSLDDVGLDTTNIHLLNSLKDIQGMSFVPQFAYKNGADLGIIIDLSSVELEYTERSTTPLLIASTANLIDYGAPAQYGSLSVDSTGLNEAFDILSITDGTKIFYSPVNGDITYVAYSGATPVVIGSVDSTYDGKEGRALQINFNSSATSVSVTELMKRLSFRNTANITVSESRAISIILKDVNDEIIGENQLEIDINNKP